MKMTEIQKMYLRARGRWSRNLGKEEANKKAKTFDAVRESEDFTPHMMYDPKTGKGYKAEKPEDHIRMKKMGFGHEKP